MNFRLDIVLTEDDYLSYNYFHTLESKPGKKQIRKIQTFFLGSMAVLVALLLLILGWNSFSRFYTALMVLFTAVYMVFYKKMVKRTMQKQLKNLKKVGKLPFDPQSTLEFHEDKLVEITPDKRIEQRYDGIERICVLPDRYLFLYHSSVGAYVLPIGQIAKQLNPEDLLRFLSQKCPIVEYY